MVTDVNQSHYGDHFPVYTNTKSLFCTSESNIILYVNYSLIKNKENLKKKKN